MDRKKRLLDLVGGAIGLFGYKVFFWGISYDPQLFFDSATVALICYALFKIDRLAQKEKTDRWTSFVISIAIGAIASYIYSSH